MHAQPEGAKPHLPGAEQSQGRSVSSQVCARAASKAQAPASPAADTATPLALFIRTHSYLETWHSCSPPLGFQHCGSVGQIIVCSANIPHGNGWSPRLLHWLINLPDEGQEGGTWWPKWLGPCTYVGNLKEACGLLVSLCCSHLEHEPAHGKSLCLPLLLCATLSNK